MEPWSPLALESEDEPSSRRDRRKFEKGQGNQEHLFHRGGWEQLVKEDEDKVLTSGYRTWRSPVTLVRQGLILMNIL